MKWATKLVAHLFSHTGVIDCSASHSSPFSLTAGAPSATDIYFHLAGHARLVANNRMRMATTDPANPIDRHVGSRLRIRRLALGMSQQRLAEAIGVGIPPPI
jgi:hypothetical protein